LNGLKASAPGKIILFGEHFVVYGEPAVVMAIDKRAYASAKIRGDNKIYIDNFKDLEVSGYFEKNKFTLEHGSQDAEMKLLPIKTAIQKVLELSGKTVGLDLKIDCDIPVGAGLGSSAAVVAATAKAVDCLLDVALSEEDIFNITLESERIVHGNPSGIDPMVTTYGGVLLFRKGKGFKRIDVKEDIPLVIGDTGIKHATSELISLVRQNREKYPQIINPIIKASGEIALDAVKALEKHDLHALGELMNINHALLYAVGVSNESLEKLVYATRTTGSYGAKLTGAGGGGCIIALSPLEKAKNIANAIEKAGGKAFAVKKSDEGVRVEN
jgi:mevalonate kinase